MRFVSYLSHRAQCELRGGHSVVNRLAGPALASTLVVALVACRAEPTATSSSSATTCRPPAVAGGLHLSNAFPGLKFTRPVFAERFGDQYYVAEQAGRVWRLSNDGQQWSSELYADLGGRLAVSDWEGGLLGLALSPDFAETGELFTCYTGKTTKSDVLYELVISRENISQGTSELVLAIDHQAATHNGGGLRFGPDRALYIGIGDGESVDWKRRAQNPHELLGKVLRIDPLTRRPYAIPADNPFSAGHGRPEVYALGLRNPWGFAFDSQGQLWLGDVGQDRWEEIDLIVKGGNYGWPLREGKHCFLNPCDGTDAIEPIHEYAHVDGFAVTGGLVYRGQRLGIDNAYVFGDFMSGRIWALDTTSSRAVRQLIDTGLGITGFVDDPDGEILVIDHGGQILRLESGEASPTIHPSLQDLGCLDATGSMSSTLRAYEINAPFWSDGLGKRRWFSLPNDSSIVTTGPNWDMPPGTMFMKELSAGGRRIETRMLYRDKEAGWLGYTFEWNETQSDAVLIEDAKTIDIDGSPWTLPSRAQCFACHRASAGRILGFEPSQLNRAKDGANQLQTFSRDKILQPGIEPLHFPALANPDDESQPIDARARAWLHSNCGFCHDGSGLGQAMMDLRYSSPIKNESSLCQVGAAFDLDESRSSVIARIGALDSRRMPPLGSSRVDEAALDLVWRWLGGCE